MTRSFDEDEQQRLEFDASLASIRRKLAALDENRALDLTYDDKAGAAGISFFAQCGSALTRLQDLKPTFKGDCLEQSFEVFLYLVVGITKLQNACQSGRSIKKEDFEFVQVLLRFVGEVEPKPAIPRVTGSRTIEIPTARRGHKRYRRKRIIGGILAFLAKHCRA